MASEIKRPEDEIFTPEQQKSVFKKAKRLSEDLDYAPGRFESLMVQIKGRPENIEVPEFDYRKKQGPETKEEEFCRKSAVSAFLGLYIWGLTDEEIKVFTAFVDNLSSKKFEKKQAQYREVIKDEKERIEWMLADEGQRAREHFFKTASIEKGKAVFEKVRLSQEYRDSSPWSFAEIVLMVRNRPLNTQVPEFDYKKKFSKASKEDKLFHENAVKSFHILRESGLKNDEIKLFTNFVDSLLKEDLEDIETANIKNKN